MGCQILPDGGEVNIDDHKVFLAHGDMVDPDDRGYQMLRRLLRSGPVRLLSRILSLDNKTALSKGLVK